MLAFYLLTLQTNKIHKSHACCFYINFILFTSLQIILAFKAYLLQVSSLKKKYLISSVVFCSVWFWLCCIHRTNISTLEKNIFMISLWWTTINLYFEYFFFLHAFEFLNDVYIKKDISLFLNSIENCVEVCFFPVFFSLKRVLLT